MKNIDVLKKKLTEKINSLDAGNFCCNISCRDCPFRDDRLLLDDCEDNLIKWLNEDAE